MADPQISQITQSQTTIPDYARSYVENLLGLAEGTAFQYQRNPDGSIALDSAGIPIPSGFQPYQQYQGERFAQFSPMQQMAMQQAEQMRPANALEDASSLAGLAGLRALNYGYTPGQAKNQFVVPQQFQPSSFTAAGVSSPDLKQYQIGAPERVSTAASQVKAGDIDAASTDYAPTIKAYEMGPADKVSTAGSQVFAGDIQAARSTFDPSIQRFRWVQLSV